MRGRASATLFVSSILLWGCSTQPESSIPQVSGTVSATDQTVQSDAHGPTSAQDWEARKVEYARLSAWRVRGKVAYRLPDDAGSAKLDWRQSNERSELRLAGPLGAGSTRINNENGLLRLRRDGIDRLYPADGAPWLANGSLLPVPVDSIRYWLRGLPDPTKTVEALTLDDATAKSMIQNDWVIEYATYSDVAVEGDEDLQAFVLPSRLTLSHRPSGLFLKILLRDWDLLEYAAPHAPQ